MRIRKTLTAVCIASLLSGCAISLPDLPFSGSDKEDGLSKEQRDERDRLVSGKSSRPSLASLNLQPDREALPVNSDATALQKPAIPRLTLEQKRDEYEALLPLIEDPKLRQQVEFRLADVKMLLAEESLETANSDHLANFNEAIESYRNIISQATISYPRDEQPLDDNQIEVNGNVMEAMYQLSRALDLAGQREESVAMAKHFLTSFSLDTFDVSDKHIELWFRIGEHYFSQTDYANAISFYREVLAHGKAGTDTDFYGISAYMLGWSHFKLDDYDNALAGFDTMLAHTTEDIDGIERMQADELPLGKGNLRLVKDVLRVMALTFSYRGDEIAIAKFYSPLDNDKDASDNNIPSYLHLLYEELAQQHLDDDRYQDSAGVLLAFAQTYPTHARSVEFFVRHIDAYILGQFPDKVLAGKQAFVAQYSLKNDVVDSFDTDLGKQVSTYLQQYLPELAQTEHSIAQSVDKIIALRSNVNANEGFTSAFTQAEMSPEDQEKWRDIDSDSLQTLKDDAYDNAVGYYADFINSFSFDDALAGQVAELRFYMAEALLASLQYQKAIEAFETYAYIDQVNPMAVEAAYAAILAWQELLQLHNAGIADNAGGNELSLSYQQSQAKYIDAFPGDERALTIAVTLMQALYMQKDYISAMRWSSWILEEASNMHQLSYEQTESALLVNAHGNFALGNYVLAETSYDDLLRTLPKDDDRRDELNESLATAIYKQAEQSLRDQGLDQAALANIDLQDVSLEEQQRQALTQAIEHFARLIDKTPDASSRVIAEYDITTYHALLGNWDKAIKGWLAFEKRYPDNDLSSNIKPQLLFAYEKTENWTPAAQLLIEKYQQSPDSEEGRLSLYTAAEYFDKANDRSRALDTYRRYAHAYEQPIAQANEARYRMSQFYLESGEDTKRRFWLNKIMQAQLALSSADPSNAGTPRSRYLAAMSAMVFAQDADYIFSHIKLTAPIDKSLRKKQKALESAINAYDRVMSFAVAEYTTAANFKLADLYAGLVNDLMDSERPSGLSMLELEQYDMLLEEQAYPFEETAIQIHEQNISRVQKGLYDDYVKQSFSALSRFMPARYNKPEINPEVTINDL